MLKQKQDYSQPAPSSNDSGKENLLKNKKAMSIKKQFIIQSLLVGLFLTASIVLIGMVSNQKQKLEALRARRNNLVLMAQELRKTSEDLTSLCRQFVVTKGNLTYRSEYLNIVKWRGGKIPRPKNLNSKLYIGEKISHYDIFKRLSCTEEELGLLDSAIQLSNNLAKLETQAMETIKQKKFVAGPVPIKEGENIYNFTVRILYDSNYHNAVKKIMEPINDFLIKLDQRTANEVKVANNKLDLFLILIISFIVLTAIIIIIFIIFLIKEILQPILQTSTVFNNLANGNLTKKMKVKKLNEIGQMASNFNKTVDGIKTIVQSIKNNSQILLSLGASLSTNMTETATAITQINENVRGVKKQVLSQTTGVNETASANEEMVKTIEQLNKHIESQSASVTESSSAVEEMVANIHSVTSILQKNAKMIIDLQEKSKQIKEAAAHSAEMTQQVSSESESLLEASSVIQNIASQTNLLAMNAAIEAAHAGDTGKGFAVVADEIRKLAEESSVQGKTITQVLKTLKQKIDDIAEGVANSEKLFIESFDLTEDIKKQEDTIMNAMQEQNTGSGEVLKAMMDISTITTEVKSGSEEMLTGSGQVTQEMQRLTNISEQISSRMNEMASGTSQIAESINQVNDITIQNRESIESLAREVEKFVLE